MYESFVASPAGATDPAAWDDIGLGKNGVGVQAVGPKVPGNGAIAPLPMLVRQRFNPISLTAKRSAAKLRSAHGLFGPHHEPFGMVS